MKLILLLLLVFFLGSCTSEYEECLREAQHIQSQITRIEHSKTNSSTGELDQELASLYHEITFLAKLSGNENMFLKELSAASSN